MTEQPGGSTWEYQIVEESNPVHLQQRLAREARDGWEAISLGYGGECRLLALLRRPFASRRPATWSAASEASGAPPYSAGLSP
jgi:hypothetical protein